MSWSISIKVVGSLPLNESSTSTSVTPPSHPLRDFTITIEPTETLQDLHSKIEERTGLKAEQQRLIYKGRLISSSNSNSNSSNSNSSSSSSRTSSSTNKVFVVVCI
mmetsp:Transcript_12825/g.19241  ORF Transcript_12825/g.19241 Transcript_12825/m.19241 type:complete len:106 (+) Transcript_12825:197-514(+)